MIHWSEGIEGEANSARRAREAALSRLRTGRRLRVLIRVTLFFNASLVLVNLALVLFGGGIFWVSLACLGLSVAASCLLWFYTLPQNTRALALNEETFALRDRQWNDVCARLSKGEQ